MATKGPDLLCPPQAHRRGPTQGAFCWGEMSNQSGALRSPGGGASAPLGRGLRVPKVTEKGADLKFLANAARPTTPSTSIPSLLVALHDPAGAAGGGGSPEPQPLLTPISTRYSSGHRSTPVMEPDFEDSPHTAALRQAAAATRVARREAASTLDELQEAEDRARAAEADLGEVKSLFREALQRIEQLETALSTTAQEQPALQRPPSPVPPPPGAPRGGPLRVRAGRASGDHRALGPALRPPGGGIPGGLSRAGGPPTGPVR